MHKLIKIDTLHKYYI